jgi:UDP-N-acetyl-D-mannosaminuronate dehydrogenase
VRLNSGSFIEVAGEVTESKHNIEYVIVTGGLGYVGSHTVVELLNQDEKVIIVDNLNNSNIKCLERLRMIT